MRGTGLGLRLYKRAPLAEPAPEDTTYYTDDAETDIYYTDDAQTDSLEVSD